MLQQVNSSMSWQSVDWWEEALNVTILCMQRVRKRGNETLTGWPMYSHTVCVHVIGLMPLGTRQSLHTAYLVERYTMSSVAETYWWHTGRTHVLYNLFWALWAAEVNKHMHVGWCRFLIMMGTQQLVSRMPTQYSLTSLYLRNTSPAAAVVQ